MDEYLTKTLYGLTKILSQTLEKNMSEVSLNSEESKLLQSHSTALIEDGKSITELIHNSEKMEKRLTTLEKRVSHLKGKVFSTQEKPSNKNNVVKGKYVYHGWEEPTIGTGGDLMIRCRAANLARGGRCNHKRKMSAVPKDQHQKYLCPSHRNNGNLVSTPYNIQKMMDEMEAGHPLPMPHSEVI